MAKQDNTLAIALGLGGAAALFLIFSGEGKKAVEQVEQKVKELLPIGPVDFIKKYFVAAKQSEASTGVPALVTIAQAGIESAWGKSAPGNNFFGVKAGKSWTGETQKLKTWECGKTGDPVKDGIKDEIIFIAPPGDKRGICGSGEPASIYEDAELSAMFQNKYADYIAYTGAGKLYSYRVYGKFRKYATPAEGFKDHGSFLKQNKRYDKAFTTKTPEDFARAVAAAGYATAPNYAEVMVKTINKVREALKSFVPA